MGAPDAKPQVSKVPPQTAKPNSAPNNNSNKHKISGLVALVLGASLLFGFAGGLVGSRALLPRTTSLDTNAALRVDSEQTELISQLVTQVSPSVVSIVVEESVQSNSYFYGPTQSIQEGAGTGIILSSDGIIVTNKHVIPENVKKVSITTSDGKTYDNVDVIARDPRSSVDIAFLKVNGVNNLKPAKLGDSSKTSVGTSVIAIGYALGEFDNTVTSGIISGVGRPVTAGDGQSTETLTNLFQTDAAINPGNSGGPLLNLAGEVIGINTAVAGDGAQNIGFAIPINDVKPQISSVLQKGKLEVPYLGVRYVMLSPEIAKKYQLSRDSGAWLKASDSNQAVINGSPADKAGLKEGDIIFKVNGQEINDKNPLASVLSKYNVGDTLDIEYNRDGKNSTTKATLEPAP